MIEVCRVRKGKALAILQLLPTRLEEGNLLLDGVQRRLQFTRGGSIGEDMAIILVPQIIIIKIMYNFNSNAVIYLYKQLFTDKVQTTRKWDETLC